MSRTHEVAFFTLTLTLALCEACFTGGRGHEIVGSWQSLDAVDGYHNALQISSQDLAGPAIVYFNYANQQGTFSDTFYAYAIVLEEEDGCAIEMYCDVDDLDCVDFTLICRFAEFEGRDLLDCQGDGVFENYNNFTFERYGQ